jgi:NAD(P)-dependent dehydrogenase (short-subunit alcohol dehydrogenase family)
MERFSGKRAIITGGASGIGFAAAQRISLEGGAVALWDISTDRLEEARGLTKAAHSCVVDISDPVAVEAAAAASVQALGGLDILVHSAGILGPFARLDEFTIEQWHRVISVNLDGVFYCARSVLPYLKQNKYGRIVLLASILGKEGQPSASAYSATKAAVIGMAKCWGKELATSGITVNVLAPGSIDTPMTQGFPPDRRKIAMDQVPMKRFGTMAEAAAMICFVASEECGFSTGAVFDLSGGRADY